MFAWWHKATTWTSTGVGVTKPISAVPLFFKIFFIVKTHFSCWISRLYLTGVAAAQLRGHLSNMNVIQGIWHVFCEIENIAYREIDERSFSNPHPWPILPFILTSLTSALPGVVRFQPTVSWLISMQRLPHLWSFPSPPGNSRNPLKRGGMEWERHDTHCSGEMIWQNSIEITMEWNAQQWLHWWWCHEGPISI